MQIGMRDAARVPELEEDHAPAPMHGIDDRSPCGDLRVRPDAGRHRVAARLRRDVRRLGDDEAGASALPVIVCGECGRDALVIRAASRQRRHDDAVLELQIADRDGLQDRTGRCVGQSVILNRRTRPQGEE
ncbi:hypothetical protein FH972_027350 [Carpinus fangiana]|uniref:Uncharacterized protein n=1 Tax=Carpinus fangiana TaxID=176857 RepID=A0A5N6Q950_9ROSI|nr:hypothetical protein FH972_027350 [Carpinus fangiana]